MHWQIGIDIGGTFTDVVAVQPSTGTLRTAKVSSLGGDPLGALLSALEAVDIHWNEVEDLMHGTTMVTNAIVENRLASVALIATEGFGDTLAIGRQNRRYLYRLDLPPKAEASVAKSARFEIRERLDHTGATLIEMSDEAIAELTNRVKQSGAESIAVALLHAYANGTHEERLGKCLRQLFANVSLSHQVSPEAREFERTSTTVLNAAVMPMVRSYLDLLEAEKPAQSRLHLMHSAGGMASPAALREQPLGLAMSGPAAGVTAAGRVADELKIGHALSFDMGGTTTDVCLIIDGKAEIRSDRQLAENPIRQPMVAVEAIGAGGGSIAWMDTGVLRVGPKSAGANPGPACYGHGGTEPTVSDANLILGYLDANQPLGGFLQLDYDASVTVMTPLARALDCSIEEAARGILRVATANMIRALRRVTVERGIDGRQCTLIAYGGAGPMHAVDVARSFGITQVVVPRASSVFSALGCLSAEMSYSQQQTIRMPSTDWQPKTLNDARLALRNRLSAPIIEAGHSADELTVEEVAAVRYSGQSYAVDIPSPDLMDQAILGRTFRQLHEQLYGFSTEEPWELSALRITVSLPRNQDALLQDKAPLNQPAQPVGTAPCYFGDAEAVSTPRYDREQLAFKQKLSGPVIIEDPSSTIVVPPGARLAVDPTGHLLIDITEASK